MIIDGSLLENGAELRARFCIIGSGMGGSALAQELAHAHQDVLVLEAGNLSRHREASAPVAAEQVGRSFNMPLTRCIELGGTSNQWHSICAPLDEVDFESRPWIPDSGWPIGLSDLSAYYLKAARLLGVWIPDGDSPPDEIDLAAELARISRNKDVLEPKLVSFRREPKRWKDALVQLARSRNVRLVLNAPALELHQAESGAVISVRAGTRSGAIRVQADFFLLCAGALETPRLLLNSRNFVAEGIGNERDLVGRYLLDHPVGHFCKIRFTRRTRAPLFAGLTLHDGTGIMAGFRVIRHMQRQSEVGNHYLWIRPSVSPGRIDDKLLLSFLAARSAKDLTARQVWGLLTNRDLLYRVAVQRFRVDWAYRYGSLYFMTEQLPNRSSRVTLSSTKRDRYGLPVASVDWRLLPADLENFSKYTRLLLEDGLRSGQYRVSRIDDQAVWEGTLASAAHHLGTARMASTPSRGVVDRDLRVFGAGNLYVGDGSVFPTAGGVNPSMTITALALRLAGRLLACAQRPVPVINGAASR